MEDTMTFSAQLVTLDAMVGWVRERLQGTGFSDVDIRRIEMALEEGLKGWACVQSAHTVPLEVITLTTLGKIYIALED